MAITKKNATIKAVRKVLVQHYINKFSNSITEEDRIEAEDTADLLMDHLYIEVWDLNKERILKEQEKEINIKLLKMKSDLKNEANKQKTLANFKSIMTLIVEGIIIASIVGIVVNQVTELLESLKLSIFETCGLPVWFITLIIISIGIISIIIILVKNFLDRFGDLLKEIYSAKKDDKLDFKT